MTSWQAPLNALCRMWLSCEPVTCPDIHIVCMCVTYTHTHRTSCNLACAKWSTFLGSRSGHGLDAFLGQLPQPLTHACPHPPHHLSRCRSDPVTLTCCLPFALGRKDPTSSAATESRRSGCCRAAASAGAPAQAHAPSRGSDSHQLQGLRACIGPHLKGLFL